MKRSPEERRVERQSRDQNPFKPTFTKAPKEKEAKAHRTTLQRRTRLGAGKGTLKQFRPPIDRHVKRQGQKFWVTGGQRQISKKKRKPLALHSNTPAARERRRERLKAREQCFAIWEGCGCIGSFLGPCKGPLEAMHIRTKGAHAELAADVANLLPGCVWHHRVAPQNFQFHAPYTKGLWAAGDLLRAAKDGKRPDPSWEELQAEIQRVIAHEERRMKQA